MRREPFILFILYENLLRFERNGPTATVLKEVNILNEIGFNVEKSNSFIATKSSHHIAGTFCITHKRPNWFNIYLCTLTGLLPLLPARMSLFRKWNQSTSVWIVYPVAIRINNESKFIPKHIQYSLRLAWLMQSIQRDYSLISTIFVYWKLNTFDCVSNIPIPLAKCSKRIFLFCSNIGQVFPHWCRWFWMNRFQRPFEMLTLEMIIKNAPFNTHL